MKRSKRLVRNRLTGRVLPCCWADCEIPGDDAIRHAELHDLPRFDGERLVWIFCSDRHRLFWLAAHRYGYGILPPGNRSPLGLIIR